MTDRDDRPQHPRPPQRDHALPHSPDQPRSVPRPAPASVPEPPRVVGPGDPAPGAPTPSGLPHAPHPAPLPDFSVPAYEPFRYDAGQPLSPAELDLITLFHTQFMQGAGIGQDRQKFQQAKRDAAIVLPLLKKQYTLACQGVGKETSQEAQQVRRNVEWVEQLLAMEG